MAFIAFIRPKDTTPGMRFAKRLLKPTLIVSLREDGLEPSLAFVIAVFSYAGSLCFKYVSFQSLFLATKAHKPSQTYLRRHA